MTRRSPLSAISVGVCLFLSALPASGEEPGPENDYGRSVVWGNHDVLKWTPLFDDEDLPAWTETDTPAVWSRDGDTIVATAASRRVRPLVDGDATWQDYEIKTTLTFVEGSSAYIQFRRSEHGYYQLACLPGAHFFVIARLDSTGRTKIDVVDHVIEKGRAYDVRVAVRGHSITSYVDGKLVNQVTDGTYPTGGVGLMVWGKRTVARYGNPQVRLYAY